MNIQVKDAHALRSSEQSSSAYVLLDDVGAFETVAAFVFVQEGVMRCHRKHSGGQAPPKMER